MVSFLFALICVVSYVCSCVLLCAPRARPHFFRRSRSFVDSFAKAIVACFVHDAYLCCLERSRVPGCPEKSGENLASKELALWYDSKAAMNYIENAVESLQPFGFYSGSCVNMWASHLAEVMVGSRRLQLTLVQEG